MQRTDVICYFVSGMGCKNNLDDTLYIQNWISKSLDIPITNVKYYCHKYSSGVKCVLKTYFKNLPLEESLFVHRLAIDITNDIILKKNSMVFVFGHSFGGAIVNKIAQIFNSLPLTLTTEQIGKLNIAAFGSIYIAPDDSVNNINIKNYISISDIAIKCNKIIPIPFKDLSVTLVDYSRKIICKLQKDIPEAKIIQICLYKNEPNERLCRLRTSIFKWEEHNSYFILMNTMFIFYTINIYEFPKVANDEFPYLIYPTQLNQSNLNELNELNELNKLNTSTSSNNLPSNSLRTRLSKKLNISVYKLLLIQHAGTRKLYKKKKSTKKKLKRN